jgi:tRNA-specific 2-thiouridylase
MSAALQADSAHWIAGHPPPAGARLGAKTRYRQADAACAFSPLPDDRFGLRFTEPQWAVTPGQSAVLYHGEICLGGGLIASSSPG